ncbi:hypothetical protein GCM10027056_24390 [Glaciibacter psychrotolerans]
MQFDAAQARSGAGLDQRADANFLVAEDDGQVRDIAAQPVRVATGIEGVVGDQHGQRRARTGTLFRRGTVGGVIVGKNVVDAVAEVGQAPCDQRSGRPDPVDADAEGRGSGHGEAAANRAGSILAGDFEYRSQGTKQRGEFGVCGPALTAHHHDRGTGHSAAQQRQHSFECDTDNWNDREGLVDSTLDAGGRAPHERVPGVQADDHAPMMHPSARAACVFSTGAAGSGPRAGDPLLLVRPVGSFVVEQVFQRLIDFVEHRLVAGRRRLQARDE